MGLCSRVLLPVLFLRILCFSVPPVSSQLLGRSVTHTGAAIRMRCGRGCSLHHHCHFHGASSIPEHTWLVKKEELWQRDFLNTGGKKPNLFVPIAGCDLQGAKEKICCSAGLLLHPVWHCCATRQPHLSEDVQIVNLTGVSWGVPAPAALLRWQHLPVPHCAPAHGGECLVPYTHMQPALWEAQRGDWLGKDLLLLSLCCGLMEMATGEAFFPHVPVAEHPLPTAALSASISLWMRQRPAGASKMC